MIRTTLKGLISELADAYFQTGSAAAYQRLFQAIEEQGYSDPAQKIEMLRVALGLTPTHVARDEAIKMPNPE